MTVPQKAYRWNKGEKTLVEALEIIHAKENGGLDQSDSRRGHLYLSEKSVLTVFAD